MKTKLTSLLVSILILTAFCFTVSASNDRSNKYINNSDYTIVEGVVYEKNEKGYTVVDYFATNELAETATEIRIASEINGLPVTKIDTNYFDYDYGIDETYDYSAVSKITLPDTIEVIGDAAFTHFAYVEELNLPDNLKTIGKYAFSNMKSLKEITVPAGVTEIPYRAFQSCDSLEKVVLSEKTKTIGERAFDDCAKLNEIHLGKSLTSIGDYAFGSTTSLSKINLPDSMKEIGEYAFSYSGLKEVTIPEKCIFYGEGIFAYCVNLKKATITYSKNNKNGFDLGSYTFAECKNLKAIYFTDMKTAIHTDLNTFKNVKKLKDIYFFGSEALWRDVCMAGDRSYIYDKYNIHYLYNHTHNFKQTGKPDGCSKKATIKMSCDCGEEYEYVIKNTNTHKYGKWQLSKTKKGIGERKCSLCGHIDTKKLKHVSKLKIEMGREAWSYTSKAIKPRPTVYDGKKFLLRDTHYKVSYKNNINIGENAKITIKGLVEKGYYGSVTIKFTIAPDNISNSKTTVTSTTAKITWNKCKGADGYIVYKKNNKDVYKTITTTTNRTYTFKDLKPNKNYTFGVAPYTVVNGKKIVGNIHSYYIKTSKG